MQLNIESNLSCICNSQRKWCRSNKWTDRYTNVTHVLQHAHKHFSVLLDLSTNVVVKCYAHKHVTNDLHIVVPMHQPSMTIIARNNVRLYWNKCSGCKCWLIKTVTQTLTSTNTTLQAIRPRPNLIKPQIVFSAPTSQTAFSVICVTL